MRYVYTAATGLLIAGTAAAIAFNAPLRAQTAQNAPGAIQAAAPRPGAPMSFADLAARLQPAVVNISTTQRVAVQSQNPFAGTPLGDLFGNQGGENGGQPVTREQTALGSGFIISDDGYIVTNNHVVSGGNPASNSAVGSIKVILPDRKEYAARLVGRDAATDIALLKIEARGLPFVNFGDSVHARVGDWVIAIGNPYGLGSTVTAGIVSALHRNIGSGPVERYIQTDAAINQGNSGGPMFDLNGNVIGINSAIFSPTGGNVGIGFAIPAEVAKPVVDTLRGGARVRRGYLGIQLQPLDDDIAASLGVDKGKGELVARVEAGQPGARAGIQQGDVVVRANGRDVTPDETLSFIIGSQPVGSRIPIDVIRGGRRTTVTATLGERPPEEQLAGTIQNGEDQSDDPAQNDKQSQAKATRESLGLSVQALTPQIARQLGVPSATTGLVIGAVDPSSDAATKGLQRGDVIVSANSNKVTTSADLAAAVAQAKAAGRQSVLLFVQRGAQVSRYIGIKFK